MMVEPLTVDHYRRLRAQPAQIDVGDYVSGEHVAALSEADAYAAVDADTVLGIGGVVRPWAGRAVAWSVLSAEAGPHMLAITRAVKRFFALLPDRRIEISVRRDHNAAHRWARQLGFSLEANRMAAYGMDGRDYSLYARVK